MQIVIEISKDDYEAFKMNCEEMGWKSNVEEAIILPKGHGDLIDRDDIQCDDYLQCITYRETIKRVPAIIKADKEGKE